jgi:hypothetical protein
MEICQICACDYTSYKRSRVTCLFCKFEICKQCVETFILTLMVEDPYCMNPKCKAVWNRQFLVDNLSKNWINNKYVRHRENVVLDRQKSLIPDTMGDVEVFQLNERRAQDIIDNRIQLLKELADLEKLKADLICKLLQAYQSKPAIGKSREVFCGCCGTWYDKKVPHISRISFTKYDKYPNGKLLGICSSPSQSLLADVTSYDELEVVVRRLSTRSMELLYPVVNENDNEKEKKCRVTKPCPVDDCRGFLTSSVCSVCSTKVCKACEVIIGDADTSKTEINAHVCDPGLVESVKMIANDSKGCPSCRALIFRVSGCDQMWCTQCHVSFSWKTGGIVNHGITHNPHYYDYMRAIAAAGGNAPVRNPGDIVCGGIPGLYAIHALRIDNKFRMKAIEDIHRDIGEFQDYTVRKLREQQNEGEQYYRQNRVLYIVKRLSEQRWKEMIQRKEKMLEKNGNILQNCEMLVAVCIDIFNKLLQDKHLIHDCLNEFKHIKAIYNDNVSKINDVYNSVDRRYYMNATWVWEPKS